jgi:DNA replication and repair protein RecF
LYRWDPIGAPPYSDNFKINRVLYINNLHVVNFKNHADKAINFLPKFNAICGNNGTGKTNLLDAINYLCLTKSYFNNIDSQNIREGENYFTIEGEFIKNNKTDKVFCGFQEGGKKILKNNNIPYEKNNEHIGLLPLIINAPADSAIITGGSLERRKFIDSTLSQTDAIYLASLIKYNKFIEQRNAQLKLFDKNNTFDSSLLLLYDEQIAPLNEYVFKKREAFFNAIYPLFLAHYTEIATKTEPVKIAYQTEFISYKYMTAASRNYKRDMVLGYTTSGVHRDDMELLFNAQPAKKWASQGQQKTLLLALRLAQLQYMEMQLGIKPILLLDDIFDKLDSSRCKALIKLLNSDLVGQVITTHTNSEIFANENKIILN